MHACRDTIIHALILFFFVAMNLHQVNCNIYRRMSDVWLSGGPRGNQPALEDGNYFFAILQPGGQHDPRDFTLNNLSDMCSADRKGNPSCPSTTARNTKAQEEASGDRWFERMFKVEGGQGQITAVGPSVAFDMYGNQTGYRALTLAPRCTHDYILPKDNVDGSTVDPAARYGLIRAATYDPSLNPGMGCEIGAQIFTLVGFLVEWLFLSMATHTHTLNSDSSNKCTRACTHCSGHTYTHIHGSVV